jgi:hypothetical protein
MKNSLSCGDAYAVGAVPRGKGDGLRTHLPLQTLDCAHYLRPVAKGLPHHRALRDDAAPQESNRYSDCRQARCCNLRDWHLPLSPRHPGKQPGYQVYVPLLSNGFRREKSRCSAEDGQLSEFPKSIAKPSGAGTLACSRLSKAAGPPESGSAGRIARPTERRMTDGFF